MKYFDGCTALITGVTSGIGEELARQLALQAKTLILVARRTSKLEALAHELTQANPGLTVRHRSVDLADDAQIDALIEWVFSSGLKVNILVNNAGLGDHGEFAGAGWDKTRQIISVNITALTKLTHALIPMLHESAQAAIINISSIASFLPVPNLAVYGASKAYVTSLTEALRAELRGTGIRVTTVCPGPVDTEFGTVAERQGAVRRNPPEALKVSAEHVAREALRAVANDRARVVPGLLVAITMGCLCAIPMFAIRILLNRAAKVRN